MAYGGLTCFPHVEDTSTTDYLIGPLAFVLWVHDFIVPPLPLSTNHSYVAFNISVIVLATKRASLTLACVQVHFDHALDVVYVSHLT